jgi:hypothetical protein
LQPLTVPDAETALDAVLGAFALESPCELLFDFPSSEFPLPCESPTSFE